MSGNPSESSIALLTPTDRISSTLAAGVAGGIVSKTGRYWYIIVLAPCLSAIGAGLLFTVKADTANPKLIGFQILYGVGLVSDLSGPFPGVRGPFLLIFGPRV